jgi:hypothetical protein
MQVKLFSPPKENILLKLYGRSAFFSKSKKLEFFGAEHF